MADWKRSAKNMGGVMQSDYEVPQASALHVLEELKTSTAVESMSGEVGNGEFLVVFDHPTKGHHPPWLSFSAVPPGGEKRMLQLLWIRGAEDFAMRVEFAVRQCNGVVTYGAVAPEE